jgi:hypothetical protein
MPVTSRRAPALDDLETPREPLPLGPVVACYVALALLLLLLGMP